MNQETLNTMTQAYTDKAFDTFVRGLRGELPKLLSIREPADLPQALYLCLKLQNVDYRAQYANNYQKNVREFQNQIVPSLPSRRNETQQTWGMPSPAPEQNSFPI